MILNNPVTLFPPKHRNEDGTIISIDPITMTELDVSYIIRPKTSMIYAQIVNIPGVVVLTTSAENSDISDITLKDMEQMLKVKIGDNPQQTLQNLFPRSLEEDPDGPGSILSRLLSYIGISATPNCSCKRHAIEMNDRGNDWCEANMDIILNWLREESARRKLPFIESVAKMLVNKAIKMSRKLNHK